MVMARQRSLSDAAQERRREKNERELSEWTSRALARESQVQRKKHEERLQKLSVSVRVCEVCEGL